MPSKILTKTSKHLLYEHTYSYVVQYSAEYARSMHSYYSTEALRIQRLKILNRLLMFYTLQVLTLYEYVHIMFITCHNHYI